MKKENEEDDEEEEEKNKKYVKLQTSSICCIYLNLLCSTVYLITSLKEVSRRGQGSNRGKPDFFRLSFRNCISCVNNCEDLLYTYFLTLY